MGGSQLSSTPFSPPHVHRVPLGQCAGLRTQTSRAAGQVPSIIYSNQVYPVPTALGSLQCQVHKPSQHCLKTVRYPYSRIDS